MFARGALYFDEVARRGSIRRASERLNIAPSAIDRQILQLEEQLGMPLFERLPQGLRLTAAGEMLVDAVRKWRRDLDRVKSQIDDLQGLRRGEVSIALVEGASEFFSKYLTQFQSRYPAIAYQVRVCGSRMAADLVIGGEFDLGLTFNPMETHALRVEQTLVYQLGMVVRSDHPLSRKHEISLIEAANYPLIIPDDSISLRAVLDQAWARTIGGSIRFTAVANSIGMIKSMVRSGLGIGALTYIDALAEIQSGKLSFLPLTDTNVPLSVLSLISASGRTLSVPSSLLLQHFAQAMMIAKPGPAEGVA